MILDLNIKNSICLSPEMQQGLRVLSMSSAELEKEIEKELKDNYLLEDRGSYISESIPVVSLSDDATANLTKKQTLVEVLLDQLYMLPDSIPTVTKERVRVLIYSLDENGMLEDSTDYDDDALDILHRLEPIGVGGSSLKEVLMIQAQYKDWYLEREIINLFLVEVAKADHKAISLKLKISISAVDKAVDRIKTLNPKPTMGYLDIGYDIPDGYIMPGRKGNLKIGVYSNHKDVAIADIPASVVSKNEVLMAAMKRAKSLVSGVSYRKSAMEMLLVNLAKFQKEYFLGNKLALKPMTMSQMANDCDVHESTISRISSTKSIETVHGLLDIRSLYSSSMGFGEADTISNHSIKELIKDIISQELPTKPVSDSAITEVLKESGVAISRRTVSKYRKALNIPKMSKRII
jgi:RNA polymerase sigma-54 factor